MTNQHPLTREIMDKIHGPATAHSGPRFYGSDDMQRAADWQLKQVLEWLNETIFERGSSFEAVNIPEELEEAMRPTTTQEDN